jgi:hypothetical protein
MPLRRRSLLAAAGAVTVVGLSGCLNRVASAVTNTGASPAAVFAGQRSDGSDGPLYAGDGFSLSEPSVVRLTPRINAERSGFSGSVDLEGWVTTTPLMAQNHNSSRSNRSQPAAAERDTDGDADGDGVDDGTAETRANYNNTRSNKAGVRPPDIVDDDLDTDGDTYDAVVRLDKRLVAATETAVASISKRSARTGRALDEMDAALAELRAVLEKCDSEACAAALENVAGREADLERARGYVEAEEWDAFGLAGGDEAEPFGGGYLLPAASFDPAEAYSPGERAALYRYLDGESVVAERFTVSLPDAEVPGGNGSIREAVTPKRVIDYITGQSGARGKGGREDSSEHIEFNHGVGGGDDCDDSDGDIYPGDVCPSPHLSADVSAPIATGGTLEVLRGDDGTVFVVNSSSEPDVGASQVWVSAEGASKEGTDRNWRRSAGTPPTMDQQSYIDGVLVSQVAVQPEGCPHPVPALLYVGRAASDEQFVYSGGWVIDDAGLYRDALTALTMVEAAPVVGIDLGDFDSDGDGFSDLTATFDDVAGASGRKRRVLKRHRRGARLDAGSLGGLVDADVLSESSVEGVAWPIRKKPGRKSSEADMGIHVTHLALDAPVLHLTNAEGASNEVKFKAGAELSGQVN